MALAAGVGAHALPQLEFIMAEIAERHAARLSVRPSPWGELIRKEDWWAIWIGLGLISVAIVLFASGSSIKWIAVAVTQAMYPASPATRMQPSVHSR